MLTVRGVGYLMGSCSPQHRAVKFRLTYRGAGPPIVTEVREPLARPIAFHLDAPYWPPAPSPAGGEQQFAFFQISGGGESGDFSLALWATLTPVAGGCAFSAKRYAPRARIERMGFSPTFRLRALSSATEN